LASRARHLIPALAATVVAATATGFAARRARASLPLRRGLPVTGDRSAAAFRGEPGPPGHGAHRV